MTAAGANDVGHAPGDPSGHDTSFEPAALDLVHVRGQTRAALPGVGAARRHLPHALAAPDGASGGTDRGARGRGVGGSDGAGFGLVVFGGVACGALLGLWYSLAYIDQTGDRRLVKHGYEPGTLKRELRERYDREHAEQIVRYRQTYRKAAD